MILLEPVRLRDPTGLSPPNSQLRLGPNPIQLEPNDVLFGEQNLKSKSRPKSQFWPNFWIEVWRSIGLDHGNWILALGEPHYVGSSLYYQLNQLKYKIYFCYLFVNSLQ